MVVGPRGRKSARRKKSTTPAAPLAVAVAKTALSGVLLVVLAVLAAGAARYWLPVPAAGVPSLSPREAVLHSPPEGPTPQFEVFPHEDKPSDTPLHRVPERPSERPRIAIIIDDLGYDRRMAKRFVALKAPLTLAILPQSPLQRQIAEMAHENGLEVMLHLPMEPNEYPAINPGPGTLLMDMRPDALIHQLENDLAAVPYIKGVNNHMGSEMTAASVQMYQIFSILKKRGLYFVDSRTTKESICRPSARLFNVSFAERDVFLDHDHSRSAIRSQIERLKRIAITHGAAVGIAHPHGSTYHVLKEALPALMKEMDLVPVSALVHTVDTTSRLTAAKN